MREPDYNKKIGFLHLVDSDIREVLNLVASKEKPLVIFIDDLDRCKPSRVAEVVEALNVFLSGDLPNCVFVIGMESGMVAAALEVANKDVIQKAREITLNDDPCPVGWRFMEKITQLPLYIPPPTQSGLNEYTKVLIGDSKDGQEIQQSARAQPIQNTQEEIKKRVETLMQELSLLIPDDAVARADKLLADSEDDYVKRTVIGEVRKSFYSKTLTDKNPKIKKFVEQVTSKLDQNPRQIKRYVNMYRFLYTLNDSIKTDNQVARIKDAMMPTEEALAKFVELSMRWPQAVSLLRKTERELVEGETRTYSYMSRLEEAAIDLKEKSFSDVDTIWKAVLEKLHLKQDAWLISQEFREFLASGESISKYEECGLW